MFSTGAFRTNYGIWTQEFGLPNHIGKFRLSRAGRHGQFYSAAKPMIYEF